MDCSPPGSSVHGILPARTRVGRPALLRGIFPTQGRNPCILHLLRWWAGSFPRATWEALCQCCFLSTVSTMCTLPEHWIGVFMEGRTSSVSFLWQSLCASGDAEVKNPPANTGDPVQSLGWEEEMATHSSILAWRIPMDRGAWWGYSPCGHTESDTTEQLNTHAHKLLEESRLSQERSLEWHLTVLFLSCFIFTTTWTYSQL